jgi:Tol biopolymer transport system component
MVGTVKPDGSNFVQFDSPEPSLELGCSAWSPDATKLACEGFADDPSLNGLYTVRSSDGGDLTRVTTSPNGQHDLPGSYSHDGSQIIFGREDPEDLDHGTLMVVSLDGTGERSVTDVPLSTGTLSPDGTTILSSSDGTLYLVPFAGGQPMPIRIEDSPDDIAFGAAWSPDGQWIVFTLQPRNAPHSDIYIMRRDGTDLRQVTQTPNQDEEFAGWGPATQSSPADEVIQLE